MTIQEELQLNNMEELKECPFCGGEPWYEGNGDNWKDDNRYVLMTLQCCSIMRESIGWYRAKDMTSREIEKELRENLALMWNTRYTPEEGE